MAVIDLDSVKTLLQITTNAKDDLIEMLIPIVENDIILWCNNPFEDVNGDVVWPSAIKLPAARMIGEQISEMSGGGSSLAIESESQGGYSYSKQSNSVTKGYSGYSVNTENMLSKWRLAKSGFASRMQSFRDRRGICLESLSEGKVINGVEGVVLGSTQYPMSRVPE